MDGTQDAAPPDAPAGRRRDRVRETHGGPGGRRSHPYARIHDVATGVAIGLLAFVAAACDTGDGKTLQPTVPGATIAPTTPITVASVAIDTLPAEATDAGTAAPLPTAAPDTPFTMFAPWIDGAPIQPIHTCDGADVSPAISWTGVPEGTTELAFAMVDESAVDSGRPFIHWVLAGVDPADISLIEGDIPLGAIQGLNFFGSVGYQGPCPPPGDDPHLYRVTMYALNQQVELADATPATDLLDFVEGVAIGAADLTGTYQR